MVLGTIAQIVGPVVRRFAFQQSRNIYQTLRAQEKIIDYTYRKTGLYNRGIVRGIKHGLVAGQVAGGILKLGLAPDTPGNDAPVFQKTRQQSKAYKSYQTRYRQSRRCPPRSNKRRDTRRSNRYS